MTLKRGDRGSGLNVDSVDVKMSLTSPSICDHAVRVVPAGQLPLQR